MKDREIDFSSNFAKLPIRRQTRVFYVAVGDASNYKANQMLDDFRKNMLTSGLDDVYYANFFIAVRGETQSKIEVFP